MICAYCISFLFLNKIPFRGQSYKRRCLHGNTKIIKELYAATFFEEARIPRKTIFNLSYRWAQEYGTFKKVETNISEDAISHYEISKFFPALFPRASYLVGRSQHGG